MRAGSSFAKRRSSTTGRPSYPLLTLFHSLLRGIWHELLDEHLATSLACELMFRRFCSLELSGGTPDAATLVRFRQQLVQYDLWER
jgi:IS5 family transposase